MAEAWTETAIVSKAPPEPVGVGLAPGELDRGPGRIEGGAADQTLAVEGAAPTREVLDRGVDAAGPDDVVERVIIHQFEGAVLAGVAECAVGNHGLRAVAHHGVGHPEGREDIVREKLPEGLTRDPLDNQRQHLVPGVRVLVAFARCEQGRLIPGGQKEHRLLGVGHPFDRLLLEDVVVVRQTRGVGQDVAQRDRLAKGCELGEELHQRVVVVEFAAFGQDHDRHGGELLRHRGQPEGGLRCDGGPAIEVGESIAGGEQNLIVPHHHDSRTG